MTTDEALALTWQHLADAEVEHDADHAARALRALARLTQRGSDAVVEQQASRHGNERHLPHAAAPQDARSTPR